MEYHIFTLKKPNYEIGFVYGVTRFKNHSIRIDEMYMIVTKDGNEIKTRVDMLELAQLMIDKPGGNVIDGKLNELFEFFTDIMPEHVKIHKELEVIQSSSTNTTRQLLDASEAAQSAHPIITDFDEIIKNLKK
jgi:hypothetical protein